MPIGKNALKRVENNGYSKVKSSAPDMENSEVMEKAAATVKVEEKAVECTPAPKKSSAKKPVTKKTAAKKCAPKAEKVGKDVEPAIALGGELPFYLL